MKPVWEDTTFYLPDDKQRDPTSFSAKVVGTHSELNIRVTRGHDQHVGHWVLICPELKIDGAVSIASSTSTHNYVKHSAVDFLRYAIADDPELVETLSLLSPELTDADFEQPNQFVM